METTRDLLVDLLTRTPEEVAEWLDGLAIGEPVAGESFNWEVFAFTAAARAGNERSLPWARIALRAYEGLVNRSPAHIAHSFWLSVMTLRVRMIGEFGAREGDAILDPEIVVAWVKSLATIPIEEAATLVSRDWGAIPIETLRQLRSIKNALNLLAHISETGVVQKDPELARWLQLRSSLP